MAKSDDMEDLNRLIDIAVDTLFVEVSEEDEQVLGDDSLGPGLSASHSGSSSPAYRKTHSSPETVTGSSQFESLHHGEPSGQDRTTTSGDLETDRAIDLAVDTLFVEEPEAATPETAEVESLEFEVELEELADGEEPSDFVEEAEVEVEMEELFGGEEPSDRYDSKASVGITADAGKGRFLGAAPSENALAGDIHRENLTRQEKSLRGAPLKREAAVPRQRPVGGAQQVSALVKLQEAILTLEWEISPRSVTVLSKELAKLRARFRDDVTMDFGALAMRLVLDYVAKRMSRAHPESIRFLLVVAGLLHMNATSGATDPLAAFHQILTRYESFKVTVRKAEGLPERGAASISDLAIDDPESFSKMVAAQALTLLNAGKSLAKKLDTTDDSRNLIRSFRFLVTRSANRILEHTHKKRIDRDAVKKSGRTR
jgi:hypothetical protein